MLHVGKFLSGLTGIASSLGTLCVVLMMLHVTADVVGRYLFNTPLTGTIVIVGHYYMIVVVFISLGVAEEKAAHISVEFLTDALPNSVQGWLSVFSGLLTVTVYALLAFSTYFEAMKKTKSGASIQQGADMIGVWQSYWAVPLGAALIVLISAYKIVVALTGGRSGLRETFENAKIVHE